MFLKKQGKLILGAAMLLALACACGTEEPTAAPAATAEAEVAATETPEPTPSPAEETAEPTEEPAAEEEPQDEAVTFDTQELQEIFESCTGISGTAGCSLKWALAAEKCLGYSVKHELSGLDDASRDNFMQAVKEAYDALTRKEKRSLKNEMRESIMPFITDSFQEPTLYEGDLEDAGVLKAWKRDMESPYVQDDWSVFWEAFETAAGA